MADADAMIERQQIELVFGLTGGELADDRWNASDQAGTVRAYAYWYEGPPEWAAHEFTDRYDFDYRTLICCCLFGGPPEVLGDDEGAWSRVLRISARVRRNARGAEQPMTVSTAPAFAVARSTKRTTATCTWVTAGARSSIGAKTPSRST